MSRVSVPVAVEVEIDDSWHEFAEIMCCILGELIRKITQS